MERERSSNPIAIFAEGTQKFASGEVEKSVEFKGAVSRIAKRFFGLSEREAKENAGNLIKQGVGMMAQKVGLLPAFSNPEARPQLLENLKKQKIEGEWIDVLANWDVSSDKYGVGVLYKCRDIEVSAMRVKSSQELDPNKKQLLEIQAKAIAEGHDIVIAHYRNQINSVGQMAA